MYQRAKILVVDDSEVITAMLSAIINDSEDLEVIGVAKSGRDAILKAKNLKPDLITMDIIMPEMDGFEAIKSIMSTNPIPIIVISSHLNNKELNITFNALDAGALTVINKPVDILGKKFKLINSYILNTIRTMLKVKLKPVVPNGKLPSKSALKKSINIDKCKYKAVALGASTGGPKTLRTILSSLPYDFPLPILVVQHITTGFIEGFARWLDIYTELDVKIAKNNEILKPGKVYIAPDNYHLTIREKSNSLSIYLDNSDPVNGFRPSISVLFSSLAKATNHNVIAGLLTGMGNDGLTGMQKIYQQNNSYTFSQDEKSAVISTMPNSVRDAGVVNSAIHLNDISSILIRLAGNK